MNLMRGPFPGWRTVLRLGVSRGLISAAAAALFFVPEDADGGQSRLLSAETVANLDNRSGAGALVTSAIRVGEATPLPEGANGAALVPLAFESAGGQDNVRFAARGPGYTAIVGSEGALLGLAGEPGDAGQIAAVTDRRRGGRTRTRASGRPAMEWLRVRFEGAQAEAPGEAEGPLPTRVHRLVGHPSGWQRDKATHERVVFREVYPGIDVAFHGNGRELEYDFIVAPGADPSLARLRFDGVHAADLSEQGDLRLHFRGGTLIHRRPVAYQETENGRETVAAAYAMGEDGSVHFELGAYDPTRPLVIDPVLSYATFLGGVDFDRCWDIAVTADGAAIIIGETESPSFPSLNVLSTNVAFPGYLGGERGVAGDAFVARLNPEGTAFEWMTYFGGSDLDVAYAVALAPGEEPVIAGFTTSTNFPVVEGAFQGELRGDTNRFTGRKPLEGFIARLSADGANVLASTLYGGNDEDQVIDVDLAPDGRVVAVGITESTNLPVLAAVQATYGGDDDAFIAVFNEGLTELLMASFLGGEEDDSAEGVAVGANGVGHIVGITFSTNFPTSVPLQSTNGGGGDVFVAGVRLSDGALVYSTYLGGNDDDYGYRIAVSGSDVWLVGETFSTNFPTAAPIQAAHGGNSDAVIVRISEDGGTLGFSTFFGGNFDDSFWDVAVDPAGNIHLAGQSYSALVPGIITNTPGSTNFGNSDLVLSRLAPDGTLVSRFYGAVGEEWAYGVAADPAGNAYMAGIARSSTFPVSGNTVAQPVYGGGPSDGIVVKILHEPALAATLRNDGVEVSWPAPNPGFILETSEPSDETAVWSPAESPVELENGRHVVRLPREAASRIFRLRRDTAVR